MEEVFTIKYCASRTDTLALTAVSILYHSTTRLGLGGYENLAGFPGMYAMIFFDILNFDLEHIASSDIEQ